MGKVVAAASMSLDGYIAYEDNTIGPLFEWFDAGEVEVRTTHPELTFRLTAESAEQWRAMLEEVGALVVGRRLFDFTDGWGGNHPLGVPVVVLTHEPPTDWHHPGEENFHFVTEGVREAVELAQQIAGDRTVSVTAGTVARQALEAGLLDEVAIDLIPAVLGQGRPFFGTFDDGLTRMLGDPTTVVPSARVTHLRFPVRRGEVFTPQAT